MKIFVAEIEKLSEILVRQLELLRGKLGAEELVREIYKNPQLYRIIQENEYPPKDPLIKIAPEILLALIVSNQEYGIQARPEEKDSDPNVVLGRLIQNATTFYSEEALSIIRPGAKVMDPVAILREIWIWLTRAFEECIMIAKNHKIEFDQDLIKYIRLRDQVRSDAAYLLSQAGYFDK